MTVATEVRSVVYVGDNVATDFPVPFEVLDDTHVRVTFTPTIGSPVVLTLGANPGFTLDAPAPNITSIKNCFPVSASVPTPGGTLITIERVVPVTQAVDLSNQGTFDAETHEEMADLGVMVDQQLADRITALETATAPADLVAGNGLSFAGPTLNVNAHADGSIVSAADDIRVGVLATDAQHGTRGGGTQHAVAVSGGAAGFQSGTDKQRQDALWGRTITAGAGLTGGGDLSANRTLDVVATDASIVVGANSIGVGVLQSDAMHGVRGGGTQHADVVAGGASGFMTGADKTKLDGIVTHDELEASFDLDNSIKTTDATPFTILSWTPADDSVEHFEAQVVGLTQNASKAAGYKIVGTARRNDGTTALVGSVVIDTQETTAGWDATIDASSPSLRVRVTGEAATTILWSVIVRRRRQSYAG
jgi:hypothetical protein